MVAHDGVTTIMDTESGAASPALFYDTYANNSFLNYGLGTSHEEVRRVVLDKVSIEKCSDPTWAYAARGEAQKDGHASWAMDVPDRLDHMEILRVFEQGMREGAVAACSTVGYMGYGVTTTEIFDLQKIAKKYDRYFGSHTRFGPTESLPLNYSLGVREVVANAVALDGKLILSHIQNQNWQETYEITRRLQEQGMAIFSEIYPSTTGNPSIATPGLMPDMIKKNNVDPTTDIWDPDTGKLFASEEAFFKMQKESPDKGVFLLLRDERWLKQWPHMKNIAIANDSIAFTDENGELLPIDADPSEYGGHPRNASTSGIMLREAREQNIPLMDMVNNLSYIPAKYFSMAGLRPMQERGRMQEGMIADVTIFNPETVTESSTMKAGERGLFTKGIPYVMVSGQLVVDGGQSNTKIRPGKPIRYPVISGTFKPGLDDKKYQWHSELSDEQIELLTK